MTSDKINSLKQKVLGDIEPLFKKIDAVSEFNTRKVLTAMRDLRISGAHFATTNGYAYDDTGRQKADELFAKVFGAERALVRTQFVSGTHALSCALFGVLRPGDTLLSLTGAPYDTMQTVIGISGNSPGSLLEFGIKYDELPLKGGRVDIENIPSKITPDVKMVLVQRSRGYSMRDTLTVADIEKIAGAVRSVGSNCIVFVDNCYGEFVEEREPVQVGADLMAGSLIKNPGGGLAPTGGYIAGRSDLVELASYRLTAPGMGDELGATLSDGRMIFQGMFLAPHVVAQALKGAVFASALFSALGFKTTPAPDAPRGDIIQAIELGAPEKMSAFCRAIQKYSPVDSFAAPEAWDMPGYSDQVIMAAGAFVQGASIELSADGPMRDPYAVYLQGGLTMEHAIIGITEAAREVAEL